VIDDLSTGSTDNLQSTIELEPLDITVPDTARRIARLRPARVVHAAAQTSVAASMREPVADARVNIIGSLNVLRGCLDGGCRRFVYLSTGGAVYGQQPRRPSKEGDPIRPASPYGWSKWVAERYVDLLGGSRLSWMVLRLANVYGPRQTAKSEAGVVSIFADQMHRRAPVVIEGDGEQTRDFIYVQDVTEAVAAAAASTEVAILNVGTGVATSINRLFAELASIAGYTDAPHHAASRPGDVRHSVLDARRAARVLGWAPRTELREGLRQTYLALGGTPEGHRRP